MKSLLFVTVISVIMLTGCTQAELANINNALDSLNGSMKNTTTQMRNSGSNLRSNSYSSPAQNYRITNQYGQTRGYIRPSGQY